MQYMRRQWRVYIVANVFAIGHRLLIVVIYLIIFICQLIKLTISEIQLTFKLFELCYL